MVKPNKYGVCSSNYTLEGECCYPDESAPPDPMREKIDLAITLAEAIGYGVVAEYVVSRMALKGLGGTTKAGAAAAKAGATAKKLVLPLRLRKLRRALPWLLGYNIVPLEQR